MTESSKNPMRDHLKDQVKGAGKSALQKVFAAGHAANQSLRTSINEAPPELRRGGKKLLLGAAAIFIIITSYKFISNKFDERSRAKEIAAGPVIRVAKVTRSTGIHELSMIGETRPYQTATLYAKVSGYLKSVNADKGDVVKTGKILAVIESPETDQAYEGALADARNKRAIAARMTALLAKGLVSQQETEQAQSDADVSSSRLVSQQVEKGYETLRAPFDGTVTARFADPGALVQNATASQASALPVVTVSQIDRLRVDVFIDQRDAPFLTKDDPVEISLSERPELKIVGHLDRLSGELDPRTKMLLVEIDIPNQDKQFVAGSFVQVSLKVHSPPYLESPVEALVLKDNKPYLTAVTKDSTLTYKPIQIADNDGKLLRIISGVNEGDLVALNVGDALPEGNKVRMTVEGAGAAPSATPAAASPSVTPDSAGGAQK